MFTRMYGVEKDMICKVPVRMLHDAVSTDEILYFANKWTTWMYFDLLRELSMFIYIYPQVCLGTA